MSEIATASINTFGTSSPKADFVQPSEEPVFILTSSQLQDLITQAVEQATAPIMQEIRGLKATVAHQDAKIAALESTADTQADNQLIQLRLINDLRQATKKEPQPLQKDRGDILRALLAANGGKMLAKDARQKMRLSEATFSVLLSTTKDKIETRPYHVNKSAKVLILRV